MFKIRSLTGVSTAVALAVAALSQPASAQCLGTEEFRVGPSSTVGGEAMGRSVAIEGDRAVIGAPGEAGGAGSTYVHRFDGEEWLEEQKLVASDPHANDRFGCSVGISGDTIAVGALFGDGNTIGSGAVYVFVFDGLSWNQQAKLTAKQGGYYGNQFGASVALEGDRLVIGEPFNDDLLADAGAAWVYQRTGPAWIQAYFLFAPDLSPVGRFGRSVTLQSDWIAVGAPGDDQQAVNAGAAYMFRLVGSSWIPDQKLLVQNGKSFEEVGHSIAIDADRLVVGQEEGGAAVFHYVANDWHEVLNLNGPDALYGFSVDVSGDYILIGALRDETAYLWRFDGQSWNQEWNLVPTDRGNDTFYGVVALDGNRAVVGALNAKTGGRNTGATYFHTIEDLPLAANRGEASQGDSLSLSTCGSPGQLFGLVLTEVNGTPLFQPLLVAAFDPVGEFHLTTTIPAGLQGLALALEIYGFVTPTSKGNSNTVRIDFQ